MKKGYLAIVALVVGWSVSSAQQMTMQECVRVALGNNLTVKRGVYNAEGYRVNKLQAQGNFLPTLTLNANASQSYGRNLNPVTYQYFQGITRTVNPSASGGVLLFNGFRNQYTYRQSKRNVEAADLDLEKVKNDVIINVVNNYTTCILNKELYENAKFQLNSSQQQLERIQKQVEAGALPKSNELTQEATVATNETNLITQENAYNLSLLQLKQSMQVPASTPLEIVVPDITMEDLTISQTPEEIYEMSTKTLPQVKSALLKVEAAELGTKAARAAYYPRLSFSYSAASNYNSASDKARYTIDPNAPKQLTTIGFVNNDPSLPVQTLVSADPIKVSDNYHVTDQITDNLYKSIGLNLSIPILNGFQTRTGVQQAIINQELANITVKETQNTLRQSIETAYNNVVAYAKTYTAAVKQVDANEEAFRMVQQRHQIGAATYIEYQVASNDLFSAKSGLARAKYNFIFAKKILEFYQGKTIEY